MSKAKTINKEVTEMAERLQIARLVRGYKTRSAFASKFNLKLGTYNAHETGTNEIGATCVPKYCEFLDISMPWFLTGKGSPLGHHNVPDKSILKRFEYLTYLIKTGKPIAASIIEKTVVDEELDEAENAMK